MSKGKKKNGVPQVLTGKARELVVDYYDKIVVAEEAKREAADVVAQHYEAFRRAGGDSDAMRFAVRFGCLDPIKRRERDRRRDLYLKTVGLR